MIVLQFSSASGIFSAVTRWVTWSDYSHVDFVLPDGKLLGALSEGVKVHDPRKYKRVKRFVVDAPEEVLEIAMTQANKKYDWRGILGIGLRSRIENKDKWFCSELVAWAFEQAGHPIVSTPKHWRITPRDLMLSPLLKEIEE